MKKIFTYILSCFTLVSMGQTVSFDLTPVKNCTDRSYCVDIEVKSTGSQTIGTSSLLLTYDEKVLTYKSYTSNNFDQASACNGWMPHQLDAASRQGNIDLTLVLATNGNACPVIGSAPVSIGTICFDIIQQGASPNLRFDLNHTQLNTNDADDGLSEVLVANAAMIDVVNELVCDCTGSGMACDDGNIYTINDRFDDYCHCLGEYVDADQDGILDGVDNCIDQTYEAENALLHEVLVKNNFPQFAGLGFVDYIHNNEDYIEFAVDINTAGMHQVAFRYALESGERPLELRIDGEIIVPELAFDFTGSWMNWDTVSVDHLFAIGTHTIRLTAIGKSGGNLDQLILSYCSGCPEAGTPCDDSDPCTINDVIGADCNCGGQKEDTDFDGICNVNDQCEGFDDALDLDGDGLPDGCDDCDDALIGLPCDDGDACTVNDKYIAHCECLGTFTGPDADNDGICDDLDICPLGNDALDADGDGTPDACDPCDDRDIGTPCDDGNPCTLLDVVTADCGCQGFFYDSDGDGICTALDQCEGFDDAIDNDGDGFPDACDPAIAISPKLEIGKAFGVGDDWQMIQLENTYQSMVVIATVVLPNGDMHPAVTRVRNAEGNQFELRLQRPGGLMELGYDVQYVVAEEGIYTEATDGIKMEVRKELSVETANSSNYVRESRDYQQAYSKPVIVGQVMTFNDDRWSVFWSSRHNSGGTPADTTGFAAGKMVAEDTITARLDETIGFIILEEQRYLQNGIRIEARLGENTIEGVDDSDAGFSYQLNLEKPNHAILSTSGINGGNGGWPVLFGDQLFRENAMFLAFEEDQILDDERYHVEEEVAYVAFEFVQPLQLAEVAATHASCNGGTDGAAVVSMIGGELPLTYSWSNGDTTAMIEDLAAGIYEVTVTDAIGTTVEAGLIVGQPQALQISSGGSAVSCYNGTDGFAEVAANGGTGQHTALWNTGDTSFEITNLSVGTYTVTITDEQGCTESTTYDVLEPDELLVAGIPIDVTCFSGSNGAVQTFYTGGTNQPTFLWSNGTTDAQLTNIPAGNYSVTITDQNGCTASASTDVWEPPVLEAILSTTFTSCNGGADGTATALAAGGTGTVTYLWSTGATTSTIENLTVGNYELTLTDAVGCTTTEIAQVTDPAMLSIDGSATDASCAGVADGVALAAIDGGTGTVAILWETGDTTAMLTGLLAGDYAVTVTDENGCEATASVAVEDAGVLSVQSAIADVNCYGGTDGIIDLTPFGATQPYDFQWSNGATGSSLSAIPAGNYAVTVNSWEGCEVVDSFSIVEPEALLLASNQTDVSCFGEMDGTIQIEASGGTGLYSYLWNTGATDTALQQLSVGIYTVILTDQQGCSSETDITVAGPDQIQISIDQVTAAVGSNADGAVDISVEGGTPGYQFQWQFNGVDVSTEEDPSGLSAGEYTLLLTDENGCDTSLVVLVESVTSAAERNLLQHIYLTPNPTKGQFSLFLDLPEYPSVAARIFDVSGKMVVAVQGIQDRHDFDLTNEAAGVYLLRIQVGQLEVAKRIVVVD